MGISGKIVTDIEYASDCVLFNVKPKRFKLDLVYVINSFSFFYM